MVAEEIVHTSDGAVRETGFYGAEPVPKPSITGSVGANAALTNLLAALESMGLIVDNTSA